VVSKKQIQLKLNIMKLKLLITLSLTVVTMSLYAQPEWNWPMDKATAEEKNVLYSDYLKMKNYRQSANALSWLLVNAPDLNPSIYINGAKVYYNLQKSEKDPEKKQVLQDSTILMYDLRLQYFGDTANVLNRKAFYAYLFYKDDKSRYAEIYDLFLKTYNLNSLEMWENNLVAFMDITRRHKIVNKGAVSDEEVIEKYFEIVEIIDYKKENATGKKLASMEKKQASVDKVFFATVKVDCEFIETNFGPKFDEDTSDLRLANNIFKLAFAASCLDSDLFLRAAKKVYTDKKDFGVAKLLAIKESGAGNYSQSIAYYEDALTLTDDKEKQMDVYLSIAKIYSKRGLKSKAREYAYKVIEMSPGNSDAYTLIGDLYLGSFGDCKKGENKVYDKGVYLAAYKKYQQAGNTAKMILQNNGTS